MILNASLFHNFLLFTWISSKFPDFLIIKKENDPKKKAIVFFDHTYHSSTVWSFKTFFSSLLVRHYSCLLISWFPLYHQFFFVQESVADQKAGGAKEDSLVVVGRHYTLASWFPDFLCITKLVCAGICSWSDDRRGQGGLTGGGGSTLYSCLLISWFPLYHQTCLCRNL